MSSDPHWQLVIKHIVEGDIVQRLCRLCLQPLDDICESIFTTIHKNDREFCVADVIDKLCGIKISILDKFSVCQSCFYLTASAYEFYLLSLRSTEILDTYTNQLEQHICSIALPRDISNTALCITLPEVEIKTKLFDFELNGCFQQDLYDKDHNDSSDSVNENQEAELDTWIAKIENNISYDDVKSDSTDEQIMFYVTGCEDKNTKPNSTNKANPSGEAINKSKSSSDVTDKDMIFIITDGEETHIKENSRYKAKPKANHISREPKIVKDKDFKCFEKVRKKRSPMALRKCSQCPVRYRFLARLKEHMRNEHNIHLYVCKLCKWSCEAEQEFTKHLHSHSEEMHHCESCDSVFRKPETLAAHLRWHQATSESYRSDAARVCEQCGMILSDEAELHDHNSKKHLKHFTCHFCGRMYKGKISLDNHIAKHEKMGHGGVHSSVDSSTLPAKRNADSKPCCEICGKHFTDQRALEWHTMLHTNDRPFKCDVCGRGFISVNRRNQHALCAHTAPTRRCPLCPALFHLRSMVNTHIKKVHLSAHKRRTRTSKHQNASWRTATVPIPELSVELQHKLHDFQDENV